MILLINSFDWFYVGFILFPLFSLLWTLFKAISLTDIKSIIAFSTISQISYMFLAILIFPLVCLFHIIIHALFKSLLFLLAGSLIHVQANFQSIYRMKPNNSWVKIIVLLAGSVLILSLSKEGIIHSFISIVSSAFVFILAILGGVFTTIYTLKIYIYCFYRSSLFRKGSFYGWKLFSLNCLEQKLHSSFILSFLTISSIFIDQSVKQLNSFSLFYCLDFELSFSYARLGMNFTCCSLLFLFSIPAFFLVLILYWDQLIVFSFINYSFDSSSSFFIPPFQYFFLLFSSFFFKAHCSEVYNGFSSCYSLWNIHYFSCSKLILSLFLIFSFVLLILILWSWLV